jgi:hypothetical protein
MKTIQFVGIDDLLNRLSALGVEIG